MPTCFSRGQHRHPRSLNPRTKAPLMYAVYFILHTHRFTSYPHQHSAYRTEAHHTWCFWTPWKSECSSQHLHNSWHISVCVCVCLCARACVSAGALAFLYVTPTTHAWTIFRKIISYICALKATLKFFNIHLIYLLTPWCRVLLEKLTGLQLVKKFPEFHGTRRFITALTSVRHLSLSWASPIQPNPAHTPTSHLLEIHPNIIHPSTPRSPHLSLSLRFP